MKKSLPKVALFYDWLNQWGGAEKVLLDLIKIYPDAPIYTLVYDPNKTKWLPPQVKIVASFLQSFPYAKNNPPFYTPLYFLATALFDFSAFDIVISTTSTIGHSLWPPRKTLFICYFHNVNRYLYQIYPRLLKFFHPIDRLFSRRPQALICNSSTVQKRIQTHYHRQAQVISPGVDTNFFIPSSSPPKKYFLVVSRLVPHKKVELAIKACSSLNQSLIVIGTGRLQNYLTTKYQSKNIKFFSYISPQKLKHLYQHTQALICPQIEDFGLSALECLACGRPVITYHQGGISQNIINGKTGLHFHHQTVSSLSQAITNFATLSISPMLCRRQAQKFSQATFMLNFKKTVTHLWKNFRKT